MKLFTLKKTLILVYLWSSIASVAAISPMPKELKAPASAPKPDAISWMLVDQQTQWVISEHNADKRISPASMSKILTAYVIFEALEKESITLSDKVRISEKAWRTGGSRMFLDLDSIVSVEDLIRGLIVQSGNDASIALAEYIAGDVDTFAQMMNQAAEKIGMKNSHFTNPNGLPDPDHYSTARDLVLLTTKMIEKYPKKYAWFKEKEFTYNKITQQNRNRLLFSDASIDGVKTGHTKEAGYCLIGSALKNNMRLTAIVTGTDSDRTRNKAIESLLNYGFNHYESVQIYQPSDVVTQIPVYKGEVGQTNVHVASLVQVIIPKGQSADLSAKLTVQKNIIAPLGAGSEVGTLSITYINQPLLELPVNIIDELLEGPLWSQLIDQVKLWWNE